MDNNNNNSVTFGEDEEMEMPPGFRFHPTDEELITHYLTPKVLDNSFSSRAIGEVDLNKCEPWDLPWRAKIGEKEWYFFCVRDRKYPTGFRTNRATDAGYWKATGKDKEVYKGKSLVGMKKTLVFYKGRAPRGEKSNWVSHEYRLEGKFSAYNLTKPAKNEWVISRVFQKTEGGKKVQLIGNEPIRPPTSSSSSSSLLPPLMGSSHVSCFSTNPMEEDIKSQQDMVKEDDTFKYNSLNFPNTNVSPASPLLPKTIFNSSSSSHQFPPFLGNFQFQDSYLVPSWVTNQKLAQSSFQDMDDSSDSLWSYCT